MTRNARQLLIPPTQELARYYFKSKTTGNAARPICYASRSLSDTEKRYAVIEKEALAAALASETFSDYVLGLYFVLETDHKPLTTLLNSSEFSRILRFRLRLVRYNYQVQYVPGKLQVTAGTLSRAPVGLPEQEDELFVEEVEAFTAQTITPGHHKLTTRHPGGAED